MELMNIQHILENWKNYIDDAEFNQLTNFLISVDLGEKLNKILWIEGHGGTGKTFFINQLKSYFGDDCQDCQDFHNVHKNKKMLTKQPKLMILSELHNNANFNDEENYHVQGNYIICTLPNQLNLPTDCAIKINFTHKFN